MAPLSNNGPRVKLPRSHSPGVLGGSLPSLLFTVLSSERSFTLYPRKRPCPEGLKLSIVDVPIIPTLLQHLLIGGGCFARARLHRRRHSSTHTAGETDTIKGHATLGLQTTRVAFFNIDGSPEKPPNSLADVHAPRENVKSFHSRDERRHDMPARDIPFSTQFPKKKKAENEMLYPGGVGGHTPSYTIPIQLKMWTSQCRHRFDQSTSISPHASVRPAPLFSAITPSPASPGIVLVAPTLDTASITRVL